METIVRIETVRIAALVAMMVRSFNVFKSTDFSGRESKEVWNEPKTI